VIKIVKEIIGKVGDYGRTFTEFGLLPGYTPEGCKLTDVNLEATLGNLLLKIPMLSAAMTSVTAYEMALAMGKAGGIGILPAKLSTEGQVDIVSRIKKHDLAFVDPLTVDENTRIDDVVRLIETHGYSTIPVVDKFRNFKGIFTQEKYWEMNVGADAKVTDVMMPYDPKNRGKNANIEVCHNPNITLDAAKKRLKDTDSKYIVILDRKSGLVKMAFKQDIEDIKVGVAISTYPGWKERVKATVRAGANLIVIDTSDGYTAFVGNTIKEYKSMGFDVPLCAGNVVTYDGVLYLMKMGADIVKIGMSSGSICSTQREKATGRAPMTALIEAERARKDHMGHGGKYTPLVMDGGVATSADMIIALSIADAVMLGGYLNRFYEAAAPKLDKDKKPTTDESKMALVETWGEASKRAKNLGRYGHVHQRTFFEEGVEGTVEYKGRLKPNLEKDLLKIRAALSNAGSINLGEFRKNAVLELNSPHSTMVVSRPHHVEEKNS